MTHTRGNNISPPPTTPSDERALTLLLADDEEFGRQYLAVLVETLGYRVVQAVDGADALKKFNEHQPDIVIMDVLMPVMDGYEATREIRRVSHGSHIPIIFITGLNDTASLAQCIDCGGDDFLTKPYNQLVLTSKLAAHARVRRFALQLCERNDELAYFKSRTEREQTVAERVFSRTLARGQPKLNNVTAHISPMAIFSGDVYQAARAPDGSLFLILGDFTGHGLSAAIGALPVAELFVSWVEAGKGSVSGIADELNRRVGELLPVDMFLAAVIARFDPHSNVLSAWIGGLPSPFITGADGSLHMSLPAHHMPLGILKPDEFDAGFLDFQLPEDGRVYFYTDGIIEASTPNGTPFGELRLHSAVQNTSAGGSAINSVLYALQSFTETTVQDDDISIIELRAGA